MNHITKLFLVLSVSFGLFSCHGNPNGEGDHNHDDYRGGPFIIENYVKHNYGVNDHAAKVLTHYYVRISKGDMASVRELGFTSEDVTAFRRGESPAPTSVRFFARHLGMSYGQAQKLIQDMRADLVE